MRKPPNQAKTKPTKPNRQFKPNRHLIIVSKGCLQNFSFLGSVKAGYFWLETTKQDKTKKQICLELSWVASLGLGWQKNKLELELCQAQVNYQLAMHYNHKLGFDLSCCCAELIINIIRCSLARKIISRNGKGMGLGECWKICKY